ncbi:hypothetical protein [Nannocystis pusilla]
MRGFSPRVAVRQTSGDHMSRSSLGARWRANSGATTRLLATPPSTLRRS